MKKELEDIIKKNHQNAPVVIDIPTVVEPEPTEDATVEADPDDWTDESAEEYEDGD